MQKLHKAIPYIFIFVLSAIIASYLYGTYRSFIIYLFKIFQGDQLTITGKNFYLFPPLVFVLVFCVFCCGMVYSLQKSKRRIVLIACSLFLFLLLSALTSYLDSYATIAFCTACNGSTRTISVTDIDYTAHFVAALFFAAIPLVITYWRSRRNIADKS